MTKVIHWDSPILWDVNICGVRGTWSANGDPKQVTCKRCRRHLSYWVHREMRRTKKKHAKPVQG